MWEVSWTSTAAHLRLPALIVSHHPGSRCHYCTIPSPEPPNWGATRRTFRVAQIRIFI